MSRNDPTSPAARFADLQRQGFMRTRRAKKEPVKQAPIVACQRCQDWHPEGKHHTKKFLRARALRDYARRTAQQLGTTEREATRMMGNDPHLVAAELHMKQAEVEEWVREALEREGA